MGCDELESFEDWYLKKLEELEELSLRLLNSPQRYPERRAPKKKPLSRKLLEIPLEKKGLAVVNKRTLDALKERAKRCAHELSPSAFVATLLMSASSSRALYQLLKDPKPFVEACKLFEKASQETYVRLVKLLSTISSLKWLAFAQPLSYCYIPAIELEKYSIKELGPGKYLNLFDIKGKFVIENVESLVKEIFVCEVYKYSEVGIVPKDDSLFVDLGAGLGETVLWYSLYASNFTALAIDASREAMKVLKHNLNLAKDYLERVNAEVVPVQKFVGKADDVSELLRLVKKDFNSAFLKMDIEGGEREALKTFSSFLREHKPLASVAAYHRWDDLIVLPKLLLEANDSYKLYLKPQMCAYRVPYGTSFNVFAK